MTRIGRFNRLKVVKQVDFGVFLDGDDLGEVLLPRRELPRDCQIGQPLTVFIYADSNDRLVATLKKPRVQAGECAFLEVVDATEIGAFLDWGLPKDLLVPFREQAKPMKVGQSYFVHVYVDEETERLVASSKLGRHLSESGREFQVGQEVDLLIAGQTDLGYKAVINNTHIGLLFRQEVFQPLKPGRTLKGFIRRIRDDGKIDLGLRQSAHGDRDELSERILALLNKRGGELTLTDKSPPEDIYKVFKVSKASYKKAIGGLYKQRLIVISKDKITLA